MKKTKIEWADSTWNPVTGCYHCCKYCYAEKIAKRFGGLVENESPPETRMTIIGKDFRILHEAYSMQARREKSGKIFPAPYPYGFEPTFHKYRLDEPGQWEKPRNIFVCSMADLFGDWVPDHWIQAVFDTCDAAPQHRYMFLTKNPVRYLMLARKGKLPKRDNMWYGTTTTTQDEDFFWSSAWNTFISVEPIMGGFRGNVYSLRGIFPKWLIVGAETGNRKGKVTPEKSWIDGICETADALHTPVFMKDSLLPVVGEENMRREFPWGERYAHVPCAEVGKNE